MASANITQGDRRLAWGFGFLLVVCSFVTLIWTVTQDGVTEENYKRIQTGMTKKEVVAILGGSADKLDPWTGFQPPGTPKARYGVTWWGSVMAIVVVFDDEDRVIAKWVQASPRKGSFFKRIWDWLHSP